MPLSASIPRIGRLLRLVRQLHAPGHIMKGYYEVPGRILEDAEAREVVRAPVYDEGREIGVTG